MSQTTRNSYNVEDYLVLEDYLLLDQNRLFSEYYHLLEPNEKPLTTNNPPEQPASFRAIRVEVNLHRISKINRE